MSVLSDQAILGNLEQGNIVIEPFHRSNLSTSSYDVCLGEYYFRESSNVDPDVPTHATTENTKQCIYNPYDEKSVRHVWGEPLRAIKASEFYEQFKDLSASLGNDGKLTNISDDDELILIYPGETILAHTKEFIGGRNTITTMMKTRSSFGRNFINVCKCAGWGDVGYVNRWTMEITNTSKNNIIPLVVGRRIAQIVFFQVANMTASAEDVVTSVGDDKINGNAVASSACKRFTYSNTGGKYQTSDDFETVKKTWTPTLCLPRLYEDRDIKKSMS